MTSERVFLFQADRAASAGDVELAQARYRAVVEQGDPRGHFGLARLALARAPRSVLDVEEAVAELRLGAEAGDRRAMMHLAGLHAELDGPVANIDEALVWYEAAADAGASLGATRIGLIFADGRGVPVNLRAARAWLGRAVATEDEPEAWLRLAHLDANGFGAPRSVPAAVEASIRGALAAQTYAERTNGPQRALYDKLIALGLRIVRRLEPELRALADQHDAAACFVLGRAIATRFVEPADEGEHPLGWWAVAADAGSPQAAWEVARAYDTGRGLPKDPRRARIHLERAAPEVAEAAAELARRLEAGDPEADVAPDPDAAIDQWTRAAQRGHTPAMRALADRLPAPDDVPWLESAASRGDLDAMRILGQRYRAGDGVTASPRDAMRWFLAAALRGDAAAREALWPIAETLDDKALAAAEVAADGNGTWTANYLRLHRNS